VALANLLGEVGLGEVGLQPGATWNLAEEMLAEGADGSAMSRSMP
jgi:hypothetical protein